MQQSILCNCIIIITDINKTVDARLMANFVLCRCCLCLPVSHPFRYDVQKLRTIISAREYAVSAKYISLPYEIRCTANVAVLRSKTTLRCYY